MVCGAGAGAGAGLAIAPGTAFAGVTVVCPAVCPGSGRSSTAGLTLTASEITSAATPTTKTADSALPTRMKCLRSESAGSASGSPSNAAGSSSSSGTALYPSGAMYPAGAIWVGPAAVSSAAIGESPTVSASKRGVCAEANAAPRASARSASCGACTGSAVRPASRDRIASVPAAPSPGPITKTACGGTSRLSSPAIISGTASMGSASRFCTLTTAPSAVCTTANVEVSPSRNTRAVRSQSTA